MIATTCVLAARYAAHSPYWGWKSCWLCRWLPASSQERACSSPAPSSSVFAFVVVTESIRCCCCCCRWGEIAERANCDKMALPNGTIIVLTCLSRDSALWRAPYGLSRPYAANPHITVFSKTMVVAGVHEIRSDGVKILQLSETVFLNSIDLWNNKIKFVINVGNHMEPRLSLMFFQMQSIAVASKTIIKAWVDKIN